MGIFDGLKGPLSDQEAKKIIMENLAQIKKDMEGYINAYKNGSTDPKYNITAPNPKIENIIANARKAFPEFHFDDLTIFAACHVYKSFIDPMNDKTTKKNFSTRLRNGYFEQDVIRAGAALCSRVGKLTIIPRTIDQEEARDNAITMFNGVLDYYKFLYDIPEKEENKGYQQVRRK